MKQAYLIRVVKDIKTTFTFYFCNFTDLQSSFSIRYPRILLLDLRRLSFVEAKHISQPFSLISH